MWRASQPSQHKEHNNIAAGKKADNYTMDDTVEIRKLAGLRELLLLVQDEKQTGK